VKGEKFTSTDSTHNLTQNNNPTGFGGDFRGVIMGTKRRRTLWLRILINCRPLLYSGGQASRLGGGLDGSDGC